MDVSLWPSPWPAEDGGPARGQAPTGIQGLASAGHLMLFGDTGDLVASDFHAPPGAPTRVARAAGARGARLALSRRFRRVAARLAHEDVLVMDIESGKERGRSFSTVARIAVAA